MRLGASSQTPAWDISWNKYCSWLTFPREMIYSYNRGEPPLLREERARPPKVVRREASKALTESPSATGWEPRPVSISWRISSPSSFNGSDAARFTRPFSLNASENLCENFMWKFYIGVWCFVDTWGGEGGRRDKRFLKDLTLVAISPQKILKSIYIKEKESLLPAGM